MGRALFRRVVVAGGAVVVASAARADAPAGSSDAQYGTFDAVDTTITDIRTGLTWQRTPSPAKYSLDDAQSHCAALVLGTGSIMTGWRLPSYKELLTLVDESPHTEYDTTLQTTVQKAIDSYAFGLQNTPITSPYWSSSLYFGTPSCAAAPVCGYLVDFQSGVTRIDDTGGPHLVRCVHD